MINWTMTKISEGVEVIVDISNGELYTVKELDLIQFTISIPTAMFIKLGEPYIVAGDVPLEVYNTGEYEGDIIFKTTSISESFDTKIFYNFFGQSDVVIYFPTEMNRTITATFDIMARRENAELANSMLDFLSNNIEDAISICFSRSKKDTSLIESDSFNFTKIDVIKEIISYLDSSFILFKKENKHDWAPKLDISANGQPTGPESVYWALLNLDKLTPSNDDDANLIFGNRSYKFSEVPKETIVKNTDVFENRVINSFLLSTYIFLNNLKKNFTSNETNGFQIQNQNQDYFRFDHTMSKYTELILKHKYNEINHLTMEIERLIVTFKKIIPSKTYSFLPPKVTSYVAKHFHYRMIFKLINNCYQAPAPSFEGSQLLLGLKNLAIIYEITSLIMINNVLNKSLGAKIIEQSYRLFNDGNSFSGILENRPIGSSNNFFTYSFDDGHIELLYEAKVYPMNDKNSHGDLVDTSNTYKTKFGLHHYCPDFILRIYLKNSDSPIVIILDAKYKEAKTIRNYDLSDLTKKYLLNIHQVSKQPFLKLRQVELLLILFAHEKSGRSALTVSNRHSVIGDIPVFPQAAGILFKPGIQDVLGEYLSCTVKYFQS
jgi:hypothetical protein